MEKTLCKQEIIKEEYDKALQELPRGEFNEHYFRETELRKVPGGKSCMEIDRYYYTN